MGWDAQPRPRAMLDLLGLQAPMGTPGCVELTRMLSPSPQLRWAASCGRLEDLFFWSLPHLAPAFLSPGLLASPWV